MAWQVILADRESDTEILDLSELCTKTISPRLSRPLGQTIVLPGDLPEIRGDAFDGRPILEVGTRILKAYQDGQLRGNGTIWNMQPAGDENNTSIMATAWDPIMYTQFRPIRDAGGAFANPTFPSPISGAEILQLAIANSITFDGALPIDLTGPIASSVDLAADLSNWPIKIGDLITTLAASGALDVGMIPVDTHLGFPAGILGQFIAADRLGSDLSASVNFDYGTGDFSLANLRRSFDLAELCNRLYYYLGPPVQTASDPGGTAHYKGNITATETGAGPGTEDLSAYLALELASRALYGTFFDAKIFDDTDIESSARKLFHQLFKNEVQLRVKPRELLYVTPAAGAGCPFRPFIDYGVGDTVTVNASDIVGPAISGAKQRIYGFDVQINEDGVERVSELIASAQDAG